MCLKRHSITPLGNKDAIGIIHIHLTTNYYLLRLTMKGQLDCCEKDTSQKLFIDRCIVESEVSQFCIHKSLLTLLFYLLRIKYFNGNFRFYFRPWSHLST